MPAKSKAQQRFMGMVHAVQKGEMKAPSKSIAKVAKGMSKKAGHDFAATKHAGLPDHVKETIDHDLLVDFNSHLSTFLEDAEQHHKHHDKASDLDQFRYKGDNSYVKSILNKAHAQFPDEPDLAAVIALLGKEEEEDAVRNARTAQWINQTQQKIDQQQTSLGQHSADLIDKEARFKAQDQRFQDFNAKVAAMNLNPVQQAQAAQEFQKNPEQDPDQLLSKYQEPQSPQQNQAVSTAGKQQDEPNDQTQQGRRISGQPQVNDVKYDRKTGKFLYWDGEKYIKVDHKPGIKYKNKSKDDTSNGLHSIAHTASQGAGIYANLIRKMKDRKYDPQAASQQPVTQEPVTQEPVTQTEGLAAIALEEIAKTNYVLLYQGLISGAKKVPLDFPNTQVPVALQDWQVRGFWDYLKSMGNAPGKEATITNLLSNPTYLLQWMAENIPAPNQVKKITRRIPKGQTPDMFTTPTPKSTTPPVKNPQSELFEANNKIEDDLLLEYLVSLNTVLDNASK
jgi:Protein of unknwon function (DUF3008)